MPVLALLTKALATKAIGVGFGKMLAGTVATQVAAAATSELLEHMGTSGLLSSLSSNVVGAVAGHGVRSLFDNEDDGVFLELPTRNPALSSALVAPLNVFGQWNNQRRGFYPMTDRLHERFGLDSDRERKAVMEQEIRAKMAELNDALRGTFFLDNDRDLLFRKRYKVWTIPRIERALAETDQEDPDNGWAERLRRRLAATRAATRRANELEAELMIMEMRFREAGYGEPPEGPWEEVCPKGERGRRSIVEHYIQGALEIFSD